LFRFEKEDIKILILDQGANMVLWSMLAEILFLVGLAFVFGTLAKRFK